MKRFPLSGRCACALALILPIWCATHADEPSPNDPPIDLPPYPVVDKQDSSLTTPSQVIATAQLARIAGGANLVAAKDYLSGRALNLKDVLDFSPGVTVQSRFGSEEARLSIRGSGLQRTFHGRGLRLLLDGLPLNETDGGFDFQSIEPLAFDYIEIYRGANALSYGSSTLGGAVNFVSPTGYTTQNGLRAEAGSFDTFRAQAVVAGYADAKDWYASLSHSRTDGYRDYSKQINTRFAGNFGYRTGENTESRFYLNAASSDSELPGSLTRALAQNSPTSSAAGNAERGDKRDFVYLRLANQNTIRTANGNFSYGASYAYKDLDHPIFYLQLPMGGTGPGVIDQISHNLAASIRYEFEHHIGSLQAQTSIGLLPSIGYTNDRRFENLMVTSVRGVQYSESRLKASNLESYAETDIALTPQTSLILGFQTVYAERNVSDRFPADGQDASLDQDFSTFSPKMGLRFDVRENIILYTNLSRSFEPPSFGEIAGSRSFVRPQPIVTNNRLDAQKATTLEIGTRGNNQRISWDLSLYHAWIDKELLSLNDTFGAPLGTINADNTIHAGAELGLNWNLFKGNGYELVLQQLYNWNHFHFDDDPVYRNNQLAGMPEHYYRAKILLQLDNGFYCGPDVEWTPDRYPVDHANTLFADSYALLGFTFGYRSESGLSWFIQARNLTNKNYIATTGVIADAAGNDSAQFFPGDKRALYAGCTFKF